MLNKNATRSLALLTATTAVTLVSTGCRSMPGASMLGLGRRPSVEALAGNGPSTDFPKPPSHLATPEAISSIASSNIEIDNGSVATASATASADQPGIPGFDISPGYALPGATTPDALAANTPTAGASTPSPNLAAAQANGIYGGVTQPAGYKSSPGSSPAAQPSGYTFGTKALTPKTTPQQSPGVSSLAAKNSQPAAGTNSTPFALPTEASFGSPAADQGGFGLPGDAPATAAITPPSTTDFNLADAETNESPLSGVAASLEGGFGVPEYSAASTAGLAAPPTASQGANGYAPGSTSGANAYPASNSQPQTNGSYYR